MVKYAWEGIVLVHVVIEVRNGRVEQVYSDKPEESRVTVFDFDTQDPQEEKALERAFADEVEGMSSVL